MTLADILRRYHVPSEAWSEESQKSHLIAEIRRFEARNRAIYVTTVILTLALFVLALILVARDVGAGSNNLVPILSASGVGIVGLLELMRRSAREWAQAGLVLGAARHASEQRLQVLIETLLKS